MEQSPWIEARALLKSYGSTEAVRGVSFSVYQGEVVGLLGPNGAGKTTTMKMLAGYLKPTSGQAWVMGCHVAEQRDETRARIGYLPENAPMYNDMMVRDFLIFVADIRRIHPDIRTERLRTISERCGLSSVLGKDIGQLSKGYRQRVGLAQAMVHHPDLLILDEPTSGLDPNQIIEIRTLIRELSHDKTIILSSHILPEVEATCSRIMIMNEGKLVADDSPQALTEKEQTSIVNITVKGAMLEQQEPQRVHQLFADIPGVRSVHVRDGEGAGTLGMSLRVSGNTDVREAVFGKAVAHQLILIDLHREQVSLEDTFQRLTRHSHASEQNHA